MDSDGSDIDNDVPDTGAAFTFGKSKNQQDFIPQKYYFKMDAIKQVCCGDRHTLILTQNGKLYSFGANDWGQLGHGHNNPVNEPKKIKALRNESVSLVACGRCHTLVYTQSGKLYSCGMNTGGQLGIGKSSNEVTDYKFHLVSSLSKRPQSPSDASSSEDSSSFSIVKLDCGADHSMALTSTGQVYSWGENEQGQLGVGDCEVRNRPTLVSLIRESAKDIACGYYHSAVVTKSGKLWTFGDGESGQLGISANQRIDQKDTPECVLKLDEAAELVSCGSTHTAVITKSGKLYTFGTGRSGQLGLGPRCTKSNLPKLVENLKHSKCTQIKCGENHTAVLTEKGQLVMFGDGNYGKLCQVGDEFANIFNPVPVLRFKKFRILSFSLGGCHSVVVAARKEDAEVGFDDDSEDELGDGSSNATDEMSRFDYLGGTSTLRLASMKKSATLPVSVTTNAKLTPRDRRRIKQIELEKERLGKTLPSHWSTRLGSLPDLNIYTETNKKSDMNIPESSKTQKSDVEKPKPNISYVDEIDSFKPLDVAEEEASLSDSKKKSFHASAPELNSSPSNENDEEVYGSEYTDEYTYGEDDDENGDSSGDSVEDSEMNQDDSGKKKSGKILGIFGKKKNGDDEKKTTEDKKGKDKKKTKEESKESENGKSSKHISWADDLEKSALSDKESGDESEKQKKDSSSKSGSKKEKKNDKNESNEDDKKSKENEKKGTKKDKSKKDDKQVEDDKEEDSDEKKEDKDESSEKKKEEKEKEKKKGFSLFGGGKKKKDKDEVEEFDPNDVPDSEEEETANKSGKKDSGSKKKNKKSSKKDNGDGDDEGEEKDDKDNKKISKKSEKEKEEKNGDKKDNKKDKDDKDKEKNKGKSKEKEKRKADSEKKSKKKDKNKKENEAEDDDEDVDEEILSESEENENEKDGSVSGEEENGDKDSDKLKNNKKKSDKKNTVNEES